MPAIFTQQLERLFAVLDVAHIGPLRGQTGSKNLADLRFIVDK